MSTPLFLRDRNLLRRVDHAHKKTTELAVAYPESAPYLAHLGAAAATLRAAAHAHHLERLDDRPVARARDTAESALRDGAVATLRRIEMEVYLQATDLDGRTTDAALLERFETFRAGFVTGTRGSSLPPSGPALVEHVRALRSGLVALVGEPHPAVQHLDNLLAATAAARDAVDRETEELAATQAALDTARAEAEKALAIGMHTVGLMNALYPELDLNARAIFPPQRPGQSEDAAELDAADVPDVDDTLPGTAD
jgi:hypothetical protein